MSLDWALEQVKRLYLYLRRLCERYSSYLQEVCDESEPVYVCSTAGIADIHSACNKNRPCLAAGTCPLHNLLNHSSLSEETANEKSTKKEEKYDYSGWWQTTLTDKWPLKLKVDWLLIDWHLQCNARNCGKNNKWKQERRQMITDEFLNEKEG